MADGVRLMLDDLARHGSVVRGQREVTSATRSRGCRTRSPPPRLLLLSGFTGNLGAGGGGVARHVAEPGMPEQVVPVGMGGEPGDHRMPSRSTSSAAGSTQAIDAGIDQDQPILAHRDGVGPDPLALPNRCRRPPDSACPSPPQSVGYGAETAIRSQIHRVQRPLGAMVGVARLVGIAAGGCRFDDASAAAVRRAALVHQAVLGRATGHRVARTRPPRRRPAPSACSRGRMLMEVLPRMEPDRLGEPVVHGTAPAVTVVAVDPLRAPLRADRRSRPAARCGARGPRRQPHATASRVACSPPRRAGGVIRSWRPRGALPGCGSLELGVGDPLGADLDQPAHRPLNVGNPCARERVGAERVEPRRVAGGSARGRGARSARNALRFAGSAAARTASRRSEAQSASGAGPTPGAA